MRILLTPNTTIICLCFYRNYDRRNKAVDYKLYLEELRELSTRVVKPDTSQSNYPATMNTSAKRALYDNLANNEELVEKIDEAIMQTKKADWIGDRFKERELANAIRAVATGLEKDDLNRIMELIKAQKEYH